jgi:hypothetical protein
MMRMPGERAAAQGEVPRSVAFLTQVDRRGQPFVVPREGTRASCAGSSTAPLVDPCDELAQPPEFHEATSQIVAEPGRAERATHPQESF